MRPSQFPSISLRIFSQALRRCVLFDTQFGSRFGHRKLVHIQRDHKINVVDAYLIRCHAAQLKILDGPQQLAADVNRDGRINVVDAYLVRCYAAQLINEFPAA